MEPGEWSKTSVSKGSGRSHAEMLFRPLPTPRKLSAEDKRTLKKFADELAGRVAGSGPFSCLITDDRELQNLNNTFLGHDYPTDVLSFPAVGDELGEIAISVERAAAQAKEFGHTCVEEICVLMLHGLLHLAGFDHESDGGRMARVERKWRSELGLPVTLIDRAARTEARR